MGQGKDRQVSDFGEKEKIALSSVKKAIGFAEKNHFIVESLPTPFDKEAPK